MSEAAAILSRRPSMLVALLASFAVWTLVGISGHLFCDWTDASERLREVFNDIAVFAAFITVWQIRYAPVAKAIRALETPA